MLLILRNLCFFLFLVLAVNASADEGKIFQVGPFKSLMEGGFQGVYSVKALEDEGNFGLGTFEGVSGELIVYKGKFWQSDSKGKLRKAKKKQKVPFAEICHFNPEYSFMVKNVRNYDEFKKILAKHLKTNNLPCAVQVKGNFVLVKARSLKFQKPPYTNFEKAVDEQYVYHFVDDQGTGVGFWAPKYWSDVLLSGLHLHYINAKETRGGHILDLHIQSAEVFIQPMPYVEVFMPQTDAFDQLNL